MLFDAGGGEPRRRRRLFSSLFAVFSVLLSSICFWVSSSTLLLAFTSPSSDASVRRNHPWGFSLRADFILSLSRSEIFGRFRHGLASRSVLNSRPDASSSFRRRALTQPRTLVDSAIDAFVSFLSWFNADLHSSVANRLYAFVKERVWSEVHEETLSVSTLTIYLLYYPSGGYSDLVSLPGKKFRVICLLTFKLKQIHHGLDMRYHVLCLLDSVMVEVECNGLLMLLKVGCCDRIKLRCAVTLELTNSYLHEELFNYNSVALWALLLMVDQVLVLPCIASPLDSSYDELSSQTSYYNDLLLHFNGHKICWLLSSPLQVQHEQDIRYDVEGLLDSEGDKGFGNRLQWCPMLGSYRSVELHRWIRALVCTSSPVEPLHSKVSSQISLCRGQIKFTIFFIRSENLSGILTTLDHEFSFGCKTKKYFYHPNRLAILCNGLLATGRSNGIHFVENRGYGTVFKVTM